MHRLALGLLLIVACGPGRQAAWEKESAALQQSAAAGPADGDLKAQADTAWEARADRQQLERAIAIWETLRAQEDSNAEVLTKLSRGYYLLADGFIRNDGDDVALLATFEKGILAGEHAMMAASSAFSDKVKSGAKIEEAVTLIAKEGQAAIYWYATNLGKFAVKKGFTTTLFYKDRIFAVMQHVLSLDESFFYAAPHRYFGAFYAKAPSFAGGDMDKSKDPFDRALELESRNLGTKVLYAEYYATKADDKALFQELLQSVQGGDPEALPNLGPEQRIEQAKAGQLLAQVEELF
jgi:hypothetical protein